MHFTSLAWPTAALVLGLTLGACAGQRVRNTPEPLPETVVEQEVDDPRQILEGAAGDLDPSVRARALYWLVRTSDDAAGGEWGPRACYDPSAWVQRACVQALSIRAPSDPGALDLLAEVTTLTQADPYVRATAALVMARLAGPDVQREIHAALESAWQRETEAWIVAPLALGAAALEPSEPSVTALADALASGEVGLEATFIEQVGNSGHSGLTDGLQAALDFGEDLLSNQIAIALIALGDPSGEQVIRKALAHPDPEVRFHATEVAAEFDHPSTRALLKRAEQDRVESIRILAQLALDARSGSGSESFTEAIQSADRETRALAAIWTLRALAHPVGGESKKLARVAPDVLAQALADSDPYVVRATLFALADAPDATAQLAGIPGLCLHESSAIRIEAAGLTLEARS